MIISPWTRGGYVYSEIADHTSTIKFLEKRFGIRCPNISPWRRAITGDLTQAFNFTHPDYSWPKLPFDKGDWVRTEIECAFNPPPVVPKI
jgi:phospholipase C